MDLGVRRRTGALAASCCSLEDQLESMAYSMAFRGEECVVVALIDPSCLRNPYRCDSRSPETAQSKLYPKCPVGISLV